MAPSPSFELDLGLIRVDENSSSKDLRTRPLLEFVIHLLTLFNVTRL
jgi:hypothetical protein